MILKLHFTFIDWLYPLFLLRIGDRFHSAFVSAAQPAVQLLGKLQFVHVGALCPGDRWGWRDGRWPGWSQTGQWDVGHQPGRWQWEHNAGVLQRVLLRAWYGAAGCRSGGKYRVLCLHYPGKTTSCSLSLHQSHAVALSLSKHSCVRAPYNDRTRHPVTHC